MFQPYPDVTSQISGLAYWSIQAAIDTSVMLTKVQSTHKPTQWQASSVPVVPTSSTCHCQNYIWHMYFTFLLTGSWGHGTTLVGSCLGRKELICQSINMCLPARLQQTATCKRRLHDRSLVQDCVAAVAKKETVAELHACSHFSSFETNRL